jgi:hypothetical protein
MPNQSFIVHPSFLFWTPCSAQAIPHHLLGSCVERALRQPPNRSPHANDTPFALKGNLASRGINAFPASGTKTWAIITKTKSPSGRLLLATAEFGLRTRIVRTKRQPRHAKTTLGCVTSEGFSGADQRHWSFIRARCTLKVRPPFMWIK